MRGTNPWTTLLFATVLSGTVLASLPATAQEKPAEKPDEERAAEAKSANPWYTTLVGGVYSGSQLLEIPARLDLKDSYTFGVSVSKQFAEWTRYMRLEGELQVLKHFGEQDHWEFTRSLNLRWAVFPWNRYIETSVSLRVFAVDLAWPARGAAASASAMGVAKMILGGWKRVASVRVVVISNLAFSAGRISIVRFG